MRRRNGGAIVDGDESAPGNKHLVIFLFALTVRYYAYLLNWGTVRDSCFFSVFRGT